MTAIASTIVIVVRLVKVVAESVHFAKVFLFVFFSFRDKLMMVFHLVHGKIRWLAGSRQAGICKKWMLKSLRS